MFVLKKALKVSLVFLIVIFSILTLTGCELFTDMSENDFSVTFLNVGQADSVIIKSGSEAMIIDSGNSSSDGVKILNVLSKKRVSKLKYVIATHPHQDHIGGLEKIINSIPVEKIIMPEKTSNTQTFENLLLAIQKRGLKITKPAVGETYKIGDSSFTIIAPNRNDYKDTNDHSVVIKFTHNTRSFLFTGDAGEESEKDILKLDIDIKSDVLKVGHHGSSDATTVEFLEKVSPAYAVIFAGKNKNYNHPSAVTLKKLDDIGCKYYITENNGTVTITLDKDNNIIVKTEK